MQVLPPLCFLLPTAQLRKEEERKAGAAIIRRQIEVCLPSSACRRERGAPVCEKGSAYSCILGAGAGANLPEGGWARRDHGA